jgi:hypothetical protein
VYFRSRYHSKLLMGIAFLILTSLACSLGGSAAEPTAAPTSGATQPEQPTSPPIAQVTETPAAQPTITPVPPTETPSGSGPGGCILSAQFISDVTIPDNTVLAPNAPFVKTWRVKNSGTCNWDAGYQLIYAEGTQMSGPAGVNVNSTAPGANVDISVNLVAPGSPGNYTGKWRLKASNGVIFGGFTVVIVVPATPTPSPTPTVSPTPTGPWNGHWETNCGADACAGADLIQTGNTVVGTYAGGAGTINGTVSGNHLKGTWTRGGSGTFDWWLNNSNTKWRGNWDGINGWCAHRSGDSDPNPCSVGLFNGDWTVVCGGGICSGAMHIDQNGQNFTGTYINGTIGGTINGNVATGQWHVGGSSGDIKWYLISSKQFNGNYGGSNEWCGYRGGASAPSPCLKP